MTPHARPTFVLWGLIGLGLAGCGAPRTRPALAWPSPEPLPAAAAPVVSAPIMLSMLVEAWGREGLRIVDSGDVLRSGDRLALQIELDQPAYVYALYADPAGAVHHLFPAAGDQQLQPGRRRVPPLGQWLRLGGRTGTETLFLVAQRTPVASAELEGRVRAELALHPTLAPMVRRAKRQRPLVAPAAAGATGAEPPPPSLLLGLSDTVSRDIALEQGTALQLDPQRGAILRVSILHR